MRELVTIVVFWIIAFIMWRFTSSTRRMHARRQQELEREWDAYIAELYDDIKSPYRVHYWDDAYTSRDSKLSGYTASGWYFVYEDELVEGPYIDKGDAIKAGDVYFQGLGIIDNDTKHI